MSRTFFTCNTKEKNKAKYKQTDGLQQRTRQTTGRSSLLGFALIFCVGAGILLYPRVSFWLAKRNQMVTHQTYARNVANLTRNEKQELWDRAINYNERLVNSVVKDPFANIENIDPFDEYYQTLDIGEGVMGYIHIPKIEVLLPIYHGVSEEVLDMGVGHIPATALPVGGLGTHSVLTGHTGLRHAEMFNDLTELKLDDVFYLEILDETLAYEVRSIEIVLPDDVSSLQREEGRDKVTLVTCTPYGVNSHRLLLTGERVPYIGGIEQGRESTKAAFPCWILLVFLLIAMAVLMIERRIRKYVVGKKRSKQDETKPVRQTMKEIAKQELAKAIEEDIHAGKT